MPEWRHAGVATIPKQYRDLGGSHSRGSDQHRLMAASADKQRPGRITVYAEVTEADRRDLTITTAMLGVEKGDVLRALVREFTSDSPTPRQLQRLRALIEKHT
jgi:hypothetical protein